MATGAPIAIPLAQKIAADLMVRDVQFLVGDAYRTALGALQAEYGDNVGTRRFTAACEGDHSIVLDAFPAARTLAAERLRLLHEFLVELFARLAMDGETLGALGWDHQRQLTDVRFGIGDSHDGGRQVAILEADDRRIVYKPRALAADAVLSEISARVNVNSGGPLLSAIDVVDHTTHGWSAYAQPTEEPSYTRRRGYQLGALLSVLHTLGSTDMHVGNLFFADAGPVVVDCETLISPDLSDLLPADAYGFSESIFDTSAIASWSLASSGAWTAIAPVDKAFSASHRSGRTSPASLIAGFRRGHEHLDRVLDDELISRFRSAEVRLLARPTSAYARLLEESVQAQNLRSQARRTQCLEKLTGWAYVADRPLVSALAREEVESLRSGDIPRFTVDPEAGTVRSRGRILGKLPGRTPEVKLRERLSVVPRRIDREANLLAASLQPLPQTSTNSSGSDELRKIALILADDLIHRTVTGNAEERIEITGAVIHPSGGSTSAGLLGEGLYAGMSGVALAQSAAFAASQDATYRTAASSVIGHIESTPLHGTASPGFVGRLADQYAVAVSRSITRQKALVGVTDPAIFANDSELLAGLSGEATLSTLVHERGTSERFASRALDALDRDWPSDLETDLGQLGMAHGRLGQSYGALRLTLQTDATSVQEKWWERLTLVSNALEAACHQARSYDAISWCRGLAGVVSAHLYLRDISQLSSDRVNGWIDWLFENHALAEGQGLCCGYGSIVDSLATLRKQGSTQPASADAVVAQWLRQPQNPRLPATPPILGFMQGTSGVVYTLVRLTEAGRHLPSILSLEPPAQPSRALSRRSRQESSG